MNPTEEQKVEFQKRAAAFDKEMSKLAAKYKVALSATPFVTPQGTLAASVGIQDNTPEEKPKAVTE